MDERPISSRMQELLQRAADERQAEQHRHGESVESLLSRVDELATSVVSGHERLTDKIDATFALTASTVDILQRLADRVDSLERSLDDITMRLGSISWHMDEVRDGEGRLADRIDESALALAEAIFTTGRGRPDAVSTDDSALPPEASGGTWGEAPTVDEEPPAAPDSPESPDSDLVRQDRFPAADEDDQRQLPSYAATAARFDPSETPAPREPAEQADLKEPSPQTQPMAPLQPLAPEPEDRPFANVVDLPSHGREATVAQRPGDEVASGRPLWGPSGDFLGSRPSAAAAAPDPPTTTVFEFPIEGTDPSAPPPAEDDSQDFFDRWGPRRETVVAAPEADPPTAESPVQDESRNAGRGLNGPPTGQRFLREVSAARESQQAAPPVETVAAADARATDDTVPPEWFASYFRHDARSGGPKPTAKDSPGPAPLPGGGRPAPGSA